MEPAEYPKRKLIAVSGMSPQIVTETLYALATRSENPFQSKFNQFYWLMAAPV